MYTVEIFNYSEGEWDTVQEYVVLNKHRVWINKEFTRADAEQYSQEYREDLGVPVKINKVVRPMSFEVCGG